MERLDTTTTVDTPERVRFRYRLAGPGLRGVAWLVDLMIQGAVVFGLMMGLFALGAPLGDLGLGIASGAALLLLFLANWFYGAAFEWAWRGQTPGKRLLDLRVVRLDGAPVGLGDAVLRNLLRGVDGLPFGYAVGVLVSCVDDRMRRLGDLVAGTVVVSESRPDLLDAVPVDPPVTDAERMALPHDVPLARETRRAIEALLRRREQFHPARVEELAGYLAPTLSDRTGVEAPTALRTLTLAYARATGRDRA